MMSADDVLLEIRDLVVEVPTGNGVARAVDGVSLKVRVGEAVGLVGESGSGKTLTLRAVLRLLPPGVRIRSGQILWKGRDLTALDSHQMAIARRSGIAMIFQEPMTALNPVMRVGAQIVDGARRRRGWSRSEASDHAIDMLKKMGVPDPEQRVNAYPHELSGGLSQRVMIAAAIAAEPELLLCDEPTTALDVTIQDQIVTLLAELTRELGTSVLYVTHDLAVVAQLCQRVNVMYAGMVLECGDVADTFRSPLHPYTLGLMQATPNVDDASAELVAIPGSAPMVDARPSGCPFAPRCGWVRDDCKQDRPPLRSLPGGRQTACLHYEALLVDRGRGLRHVEPA